jgi:hypothetical protein
VNSNLGDSLNVQKQMLEVLSKIHGLMSNRSGSGEKSTPVQETPSTGRIPNAGKEILPNPALDLRRRAT